MSILGFSSSPVIGGNVDRMVQYILDHSAKQSEFINLTKLSYLHLPFFPASNAASARSAESVAPRRFMVKKVAKI